MREKEYRDFLIDRRLNEDEINDSIKSVKEFIKHTGKEFSEVTIDDVKVYMKHLIERGLNTKERIYALARYAYMINSKEVYIYFTKLTGGRTILPSIKERLEKLTDLETSEKVFKNIQNPPLGSPPEAYPPVTKRLMDNLIEYVPTDAYQKVLAGNHHRIPLESFRKHKKWFKEAGSIDAYLKKMHDEAVKELDHYQKKGLIWYEQEITPEIVEYVKENQEILSGVRDGDYIYMTKFPYSPREYLAETDPLLKRYYMCHCPLAREAIIRGEPEIPLEWCYCSAGFGKNKFDVVFETETEAEVLEAAVDGSDKCRFRVMIPVEFRE